MSDFSPIARLLKIVNEAKVKDAQQSSKKLWADVLGFDEEDNISAYEVSLSFYRMISHVEHTLISVSKDNDSVLKLYDKAFIKLKKIPSLIPSSQAWLRNSNLLSVDVTTSLEFGKALYDAKVSNIESKIDDEYLKDLSEKVEILWEEVFSSDLPRDFRLKILDDISALKKSIVYYENFGMDDIENAISSVGGRVGLHQFELDKLANASFFSSFGDVVESFVNAAKAANESFAMIENGKRFMNMITGGGDG